MDLSGTTSRDVRIGIRRDFCCGDYEVIAWNRGWHNADPAGSYKASVVTDLVLTEVEGEFGVAPPGLRVSHETLQAVFNEMWTLGFRPQDGTGNTGHVGSLKDHVGDLREIVMRLLPEGGDG